MSAPERAKTNGVQPATPCTADGLACWGLTKREAFAMAALNGMASNSTLKTSDPDRIAQDSTRLANSLLLALEES